MIRYGANDPRSNPMSIPDNIGNYAGNATGSMYPGLNQGASMTYGAPAGQPAKAGATGNPNSAAAIKYLNRVIKGKELPYDKETRANMLSEQSGMAAAAEGARNSEVNASAVAGGASYNDPSLAGFRASSMARRQSDNMGAAREIAQNANVANFGAKESAARALATFGLAESDRAAAAMKDWQNSGMPYSKVGGWQGTGQGQQITAGGATQGAGTPFPQQQQGYTGQQANQNMVNYNQAGPPQPVRDQKPQRRIY